MCSFIVGAVEGAEVIEEVRNQITFQIPPSLQDPILLSEIFATIESEKDSHGIKQWEILQTRLVVSVSQMILGDPDCGIYSLEDVFLSCVGRDKID